MGRLTDGRVQRGARCDGFKAQRPAEEGDEAAMEKTKFLIKVLKKRKGAGERS
jgi:hypothetical protein